MSRQGRRSLRPENAGECSAGAGWSNDSGTFGPQGGNTSRGRESSSFSPFQLEAHAAVVDAAPVGGVHVVASQANRAWIAARRSPRVAVSGIWTLRQDGGFCRHPSPRPVPARVMMSSSTTYQSDRAARRASGFRWRWGSGRSRCDRTGRGASTAGHRRTCRSEASEARHRRPRPGQSRHPRPPPASLARRGSSKRRANFRRPLRHRGFDSSLDWTILQPPQLTGKLLTGRYRTSRGHNVRGGRSIPPRRCRPLHARRARPATYHRPGDRDRNVVPAAVRGPWAVFRDLGPAGSTRSLLYGIGS